jgi:hypothetical protein
MFTSSILILNNSNEGGLLQPFIANALQASPTQVDVPSTPMPSHSSATSPAWDPSSRTPLFYSSCIPCKYLVYSTVLLSDLSIVLAKPSGPVEWILAPELYTTSFLVRIQGTKGDGGWERGRYENDMAAFQGLSNIEGSVKVQLQARVPKKIDIPACFLAPVAPFKKVVGAKAIVIFGDAIGSEVEVKSVDGDYWTVLDPASDTESVYPRRYLAALPIIRRT